MTSSKVYNEPVAPVREPKANYPRSTLRRATRDKNIPKTGLAEAKERTALRALPHDCKKCGQSSEYARLYGCPAGFEDCPHDKKHGNPGNKIPKTGLADVLRDWMISRGSSAGARRFYMRELCEALCVPTGDERQKARMALYDFVARGEVIFRVNRKRKRRHYLYNLKWCKAQKGKINKKMFKAMYVSATFAVTDIQRLAGIEDRNWIDKKMRWLKKEGYLQQVGRRLCAHGSGAEKLWRVADRDRFKLELMNPVNLKVTRKNLRSENNGT